MTYNVRILLDNLSELVASEVQQTLFERLNQPAPPSRIPYPVISSHVETRLVNALARLNAASGASKIFTSGYLEGSVQLDGTSTSGY